jgi:hypothetical protein
VQVERQRAHVLDDEQVGTTDCVEQHRIVDRPRVGDRESRDGHVVGRGLSFERTRDAPNREPELAERPRPLARLDRHTVVAAEAIGDDRGLRSHPRTIPAEFRNPWRQRVVRSCKRAGGAARGA